MGKKKPAAANSTQLIIEKGLRIAVWILAVMHTLLSVFRYAIDITPFQAFERWYALVLLVSSLVYLLLNKLKYAPSIYRVKSFFSSMKSYEQIFLVALFLWLVLICWIWQLSDGTINYMKTLDWWLLDTAVIALVLFPLPLYAGKEKAKLYVEGLLHILSIAYTVFTGWCLWHVFHLNVLTLPSGNQVGMTSTFQLQLGYHFNITGAISFTILAISCYMIVTQKVYLKIIYGIAAFLHLWVCMLTNSRTVYLCVLFLGAASVFFLLWYSLREKKLMLRILISAAAAGAVLLFLRWFRGSTFVWFDSITNFKTLAGIKDGAEGDVRELTNLSGRPKIWLGAVKIMLSSPKAFFFGVTPLGVTEALKTYGGLTFDCAHAHNAVLQVGAAMGVPAMIAFIVFIVRIVIQCIKLYMKSKGLVFKKVFIIPIVIASLMIMNLAEAYLIAYFSVMSCVFFLTCGVLTYKLKNF